MANNKKPRENKTSSIVVRVEPSSKTSYKSLASDRGMTLSELIIARLDDVPIDNFHDKELKTQLLLLKREMNFIGVNINQVTHALHILKNQELPVEGELKVFNELLKIYNDRITEMNNQFKAILNF